MIAVGARVQRRRHTRDVVGNEEGRVDEVGVVKAPSSNEGTQMCACDRVSKAGDFDNQETRTMIRRWKQNKSDACGGSKFDIPVAYASRLQSRIAINTVTMGRAIQVQTNLLLLTLRPQGAC